MILHKTDGSMVCITPTSKGLYHCKIDSNVENMWSLVTTVADKADKYTQLAIRWAQDARRFQNIIMRPGSRELMDVAVTHLKGCSITRGDVIAAEDIIGPNLGALKGKTVSRPGQHVQTGIDPVPHKILKTHRSIALAINIMFINSVAFLLTTSRNLKFGTVEALENRQVTTIVRKLKTIERLYHQRGFRIVSMLADPEFEPIRPEFPYLNCCAANEHVPDIERYVRTVKDRVRSTYPMLPFKRVPRVMLIHLIKNTVFWLNALPARDGVSSTHSPRYLMTGQELNYNNHVRLEFGEYVQTHEEHTNNMNETTMGAICLGPTGNQQGSHWFLSLATGARVSCRRWTQLPMPREVIHQINELGKQQRMLLTLTFGNRHGREIEDRLVNVDDDDSSEDEYDPHFDDRDDASDDDLSYDTDDDPDDDDGAPGGNGYPGHQHQLADVLDHEHENAPAIGENGAIDEGHEEDDASVTSSESGGESIDDQEALNNVPLDPIGPADEPVDEPGETHETPGVGNIGHADEPGKVHETPGVGDIGYGEPGVNDHIEGDAVEAENAGVEDPNGSESQSESETESDAFARAEASGRQRALAGTIEQPTWTNRGKTKDPAFEYLHTLFGSTDPETVFTLLTGRESDHILSFLTEQMSAKRGLRQFGNAGAQAIMSELEQLVYRKVMEGRSANDVTTSQKKAALKYLMFLKQKQCGKIKGRGCADGQKQWMYKSKDEMSSPPV